MSSDVLYSTTACALGRFVTNFLISSNSLTVKESKIDFNSPVTKVGDCYDRYAIRMDEMQESIEIISKCKRGSENEDVYFANPCVSNFKPGMEKAKLFSVEAYYSDKSFGVHKPWAYLTNDEMEEKVKTCAPLKELLELNK